MILFCFQEEDGIRDLVRSRGLGDVYERQSVASLSSSSSTSESMVDKKEDGSNDFQNSFRTTVRRAVPRRACPAKVPHPSPW